VAVVVLVLQMFLCFFHLMVLMQCIGTSCNFLLYLVSLSVCRVFLYHVMLMQGKSASTNGSKLGEVLVMLMALNLFRIVNWLDVLLNVVVARVVGIVNWLDVSPNVVNWLDVLLNVVVVRVVVVVVRVVVVFPSEHAYFQEEIRFQQVSTPSVPIL
jgi:hypothetical protein